MTNHHKLNYTNIDQTYMFDQYSCNLTYGDLSYDQINIDMKPIIGLDEFSFNVDEE